MFEKEPFKSYRLNNITVKFTVRQRTLIRTLKLLVHNNSPFGNCL
jgi:hypothetical protein